MESNQESCDMVDEISNTFVKDVCQRECHFCKATCDNRSTDTVSFVPGSGEREVSRTCEFVGANPSTCKLRDTSSPRSFLVEDTCQKECLPVCPVSCDNLPTATVAVLLDGQDSPQSQTCAFVRENRELCDFTDESREGERLVSSVCQLECLGECTASPTLSPTSSPTVSPTQAPTDAPTSSPSLTPTVSPSATPTASPTASPSSSPTQSPTASPTVSPSDAPTTTQPTELPSSSPSRICKSSIALLLIDSIPLTRSFQVGRTHLMTLLK